MSETSDWLPATKAQLGIWLGQQKNPHSSIYVASEALWLDPKLDLDVWHQAVERVIQASTTLWLTYQWRTVGTSDNSGLYFRINKPESVELPILSDGLAPHMLVNHLLSNFDLQNPPWFQVGLSRQPQGQWLFVLSAHHLALDGHGFNLLMQTVLNQYETRLQSGQWPPVPFGDFITAINECKQFSASGLWQRSAQFWQQKLAPIEKVARFKDPQSPNFKGTQNVSSDGIIDLNFSLALDQIVNIQKSSQALNLAWHEWLYCTLAVTLHRWSNSSQIILGLVQMMRLGSEFNRTPGMAMNINPLPIQVDTKQTNSLLAWVEATKQANHDISPHRYFRYEDIQQQLKSNEAFSNGVFGPVINLMPFKLDPLEKSLTRRVLHAGPVEDLAFNLYVDVEDNKLQSLTLSLAGSGDRYAYSDLDSIADCWLETIAAMTNLETKDIPPFSRNLSWLSGPSQTTQPLFPQRLLEIVRSNGGKKAVQLGDSHLSYDSLLQRVNGACNDINKQRLELQEFHLIAIRLPRSLELVVTVLACQFLGIGFVILDEQENPRESLKKLKRLNINLVVSNMTDHFGSSIKVITPSLTSTPVLLGAGEKLISDPTKTAYCIFTSGSTGVPKAIAINHQALADFCNSASITYGFTANDRILQFATATFDTFIEELFVGLWVGATVCLRSDDCIESFEAFNEFLHRQQITQLDLPTAFWHEWVQWLSQQAVTDSAALQTLHHLKGVIIGGEAVRADCLDQWLALPSDQHNLLWNSYGPSEATVVATVNQVTSTDGHCIGVPLPGRDIAIVDTEGHIVVEGEEGELVILGQSLATEYIGQPMLTHNKFQYFQHSNSSIRQRGYRTGDKAVIRKGKVFYLGRLDHEVKIRGKRVNLLALEQAIAENKMIKEVCAVLSATSSNNELHAHVVCNKDIDPVVGKDSILAELVRQHPGAVLPHQIWFHDALPKTPSGKIARKPLEHWSPAPSQPKPFTEKEQQVVEVWQQILGTPIQSVHEDFFKSGGDSISAIRLVSELNKHMDTQLKTSQIFSTPTAYQLAKLLESKGNGEDILKSTDFKSHGEFTLSHPVAPRNAKTGVLLTGATGYFGIHILHHLLLTTESTIFCLVRANSVFAGRQRLLKQLDSFQLKLTPKTNLAERVKVVCGDLAEPDLAIASSTLASVKGSIGHIIHSGASVSVLQDYGSLKSANVDSTQWLANLAAEVGAQLLHISTISVALGPQVNPNDGFVPAHDGLKDGYQQSKWVAETNLANASNQGLPVKVIRLPRISPPIRQPFHRINNQDISWSIVSASVLVGAKPDVQFLEPWTPVDLAADWLGQQLHSKADANLQTLFFGHQVSLDDLFSVAATACGPLPSLPLPQWLEKLTKANNPELTAIATVMEGFKPAVPEAKPITLAALTSDHDSDSQLEPYLARWFKVGSGKSQ